MRNYQKYPENVIQIQPSLESKEKFLFEPAEESNKTFPYVSMKEAKIHRTEMLWGSNQQQEVCNFSLSLRRWL